MKRLRAYLSSTFDDLQDYRAAVFSALEKAGLDVARMEAYTAADERPLELCLRDVAESDLYLGVFAWRYGYQPPANHGNPQGKSITELEYRQAEASNRRKLIFLAHPDTKAIWPDRFKDEVTGEGKHGAELDKLRKELGTEKTVSFFCTPEELATRVLAAIMRSGACDRVYNIPNTLPGFVPRSILASALVESLAGPGAAGHVVLHGPGGTGKTTQALHACHVPEVVKAFPDGMLWTSFGENPDIARKIGDLYTVVTGSTPKLAGVDDLGQALNKAINGRRFLLVVDDIWRKDDLSQLLAIQGPRLLVTSRIRTLAEQSDWTAWREISVDEMTEAEAAALLGRGLSPDTADSVTLCVLANRLKCWPLLLELANARLREEHRMRHGNLAECVDHVTTLLDRRGVFSFDRHDSKSRNSAVQKSIEVGLDFVEEGFPGISEKAAAISIFPEDTPIPVGALAELWGMDVFDVEEDVVRPLDSVSIIAWDRSNSQLRLHDMLRCALATRLVNPAAVHRQLVAAWSDPYHLPSEYAWRWFGWHCWHAKEENRLRNLLLDFHWLQNLLDKTDVDTVLGDLDRIRHDPQVTELQSACTHSGHTLSKDKSQLAGQLLGRISVDTQPLRDRILEQALASRTPWLRPLTPSLSGDESIRWLRPDPAESLHTIAFSSNGMWAAHISGEFGGAPRDVILWNLHEWESRGPHFRTLSRLDPFALAVSDDARWCLYADSIGGVHRLGISDRDGWEVLAHRNETIARWLAISANGGRALSACYRGRLVAWDFDAERYEVISDESPNRVEALCLDARGESAAVARMDGSVVLLDLWPARQRTAFKLPGEPSALARSPDNSIVVAATADGQVEVHSPNVVGPLASFTIQGRPMAMAVSPDGQHLAIGTERGTVEVRTVADGGLSARYGGAHTHEVKCIAFSQQGARVVSADSLHIKEWPIKQTAGRGREATGPLTMGPVGVTADGRHAVAMLEDGRMGVWNLRTGALESALPNARSPRFGESNVGPPNGLALAANAPRVLSWNRKCLQVWDLRSGASVGSRSTDNTRDAAITSDGLGVVFVNDMSIQLWRPEQGECIELKRYEGDRPRQVAVSPDGERALCTGRNGSVHVFRLSGPPNEWDGTMEDLFCSTSGGTSLDTAAFVGPREAIVTSSSGGLFVLDAHREQSPIASLTRLEDSHETSVNRLLVNRDAGRLVTSSADGTVKVWDLATHRNIGVLTSHQGIASQLSVSAQRLLLSSGDGVLKLVLLHDKSLLAAFQADKQITSCAADAELQCIVARDEGGQLHFLRTEEGV